MPVPVARAVGIAAFVALVALGAHVRLLLPGTPVPVTLQTLFVLLAGVVLGPRDGPAAMALYVALGAAGVPVFALGGAAGLLYLAGPTGGYLVGFVAAAVLAGLVSRRLEGPAGAALGLLAGECAILGLGVLHLALFLGMGFGRALTLGAVPFLAGDAVKLAAAFVAAVAIRAVRRRPAAD
jgi:biotin transport system substrate-specific component